VSADETYTVTEQAPRLAAELLAERDRWAGLLGRAERAGLLPAARTITTTDGGA
jgi:hypothetical protein